MKKLKTLAGVLFSLILVLYLFHDINWESFFNHIIKGRKAYVFSAVIIYLLSFFIRGKRWQSLISHIKHTKLRETTGLLFAGYATNNIFPMRFGELCRAHLLGKRNGISRTSAFASVFVERVFDGLTLVIIIAVTTAFHPFPKSAGGYAIAISLLFFTIFIFLVYGSFSKTPLNFTIKLKERFSGFIKLLFSMIEKFLKGANSLNSPFRVIKITALSVAVWLTEVVVYILICRAFDINIPFVAYFYMLCAVNLGMLVAPTPAGLGVFQAAVVSTMQLFSVTYEKSMAAAVVLHGIQIIPVTIIGIAWFYINHISFSKIEKEMKND
ncbi:MAG: lysylphosphatidylglycerol synthase transmembrane domain-containing protein [bacterium]